VDAVTVAAQSMQAGRPAPFGARWDGAGVNFAVFSAHAQRIELCVFDEHGGRELRRIDLPGRSRDVWHGYLPGAAPGLVYGFRAHGPWQPASGHRFDAGDVLLDPWAREIVTAATPRARVVHEEVDWTGHRRPSHARQDLVLYELHVKGFTQRHPDIPPALRGTYAGLAHPAALGHLRRLGVTAVSLLPVHQHIDEPALQARGLTNYWGYNTLGFFCPEPRYAASAAAGGRAVREEFRAMVRTLHAAGIEVIIDVVFNHTCESDEDGPTIAWRGLDNASWYRLRPDDPGRYVNDSGCGNVLDLRRPRVLQFVMDSLRHWVSDMGVDGFRFDLAPALARGDDGFSAQAPIFAAIAQHPTLAGVRLIAEPWDVGPGGYQLGAFPAGWAEWNDRFRDGIRRWWLRKDASRGEFALRLCASSDVFRRAHRQPSDSVNYVVSHDGSTLRDLVTYAHRRNEANGEGNRDGHSHEHGTNFGVEGECDDATVRAARARAIRALLATLTLAQGTPMIAAGAELGHTQRGNNNPYCQDNEVAWLDWDQADPALVDFVAKLLRLRRERLPFADHWYEGVPDSDGVRDVSWSDADGRELDAEAWQSPDRGLTVLIGRPGRDMSPAVRPLLLLVNGDAASRVFRLPSGRWSALLDSGETDGTPREVRDGGDGAVEGQRCVDGDRMVMLERLPEVAR
jgi:glycogen operon protein